MEPGIFNRDLVDYRPSRLSMHNDHRLPDPTFVESTVHLPNSPSSPTIPCAILGTSVHFQSENIRAQQPLPTGSSRLCRTPWNTTSSVERNESTHIGLAPPSTTKFSRVGTRKQEAMAFLSRVLNLVGCLRLGLGFLRCLRSGFPGQDGLGYLDCTYTGGGCTVVFSCSIFERRLGRL
ncbi:uncharacterized protein BO95DRAFT_247040 [Aspergillus brunneoviolaceus CBS 621.78]|uniref:Uncharacterized protein n=1 Tax=Aspergillus brunneoviolaceus CBS 621.78 TaxID=1450534 RepID=A0ACD1GKR7_9EURO|nr:hypothetical protein BO95DRAFT_247040 [Aspergillus brunneoviolaceus CBS 621.78]RAH49842.1 hypothetical protein BO95DRAFT_247040 [Aspergillus brunneoviolaceus CBS 621.78]